MLIMVQSEEAWELICSSMVAETVMMQEVGDDGCKHDCLLRFALNVILRPIASTFTISASGMK